MYPLLMIIHYMFIYHMNEMVVKTVTDFMHMDMIMSLSFSVLRYSVFVYNCMPACMYMSVITVFIGSLHSEYVHVLLLCKLERQIQ